MSGNVQPESQVSDTGDTGTDTVTADRRALNALQTPVVVLGGDDRIAFINGAAQALLGRGERQALGQPLEALVCQCGTLGSLLERAREAGSLVERDLEFESADQAEHVADLVLSCQGEELVAEFQLLDWHRERVGRSLDSTLALAHTQVLRGLAHELNNPLGGIRGAAQLLSRSDSPEDRNKLATLILEEVDRLGGLLKRFTQTPRVKPSNVDIHRLLENVCRLILGDSAFDVAVERDYDPSIPQLSADPELLTQVLLNLARNAAQFGARKIGFRTRAEHQVPLGSGVCPVVLRVDIRDDGPGIEPDLAELIFLPLVSGRAGGSGLGLALSQAIARAHGGLIRCKSRPGATVFSLFLPLDRGASA